MSDQLPSIDNLPESELPSVDDFIKDEQKLPSVQDFIENPDESDEIEAEKLEEGNKCGEGEYFCNDEQKCKPIPKGHKVLEDGELVKEEADLTEILRLINNVRKDIPDIPEIKYYDEELKQLSEQVEQVRDSIPEIPEPPEIPEIKYYDDEIASLREEINQNAADIPEIKYYDEQVNDLEEKIKVIKEDIVNLPEPKYYEADLESLKEDILAVKESIPVFPKWVNEVNQVPDFSWIGKTFGVIDDDFSKVNDHINDLKDKFNDDLLHLTEDLDKKNFEKKVEINEVNKNLKETKDKIYKELREAALSIHDAKHGYKNDDRLLKKDILGKLNVLKQRVEEEVKEFNRKNTEAKDIFDGYFTALTEEIENLPKVKYYDEDIKKVREEFNVGLSSLKILVEEIKGKQEVLKEEVNSRPIQPDPEESNVDPLTPTNQNFATHEDLAKHYRLFVNRVQQQLYTIGGGGAGFIKDLDDVSFDNDSGTNKLLIYNGSGWVGIASTALVGSAETLDKTLKAGNVTGVGMSVGVITATSGYFSGILTAAQLNYDVVTDIYSTGIVTATKGIQQTGNEGLHVTAGVSTFVGLTSCLAGLHVRAGSANTALIVEGHGRITGILTIGTGSITLDAANNKVKVGTGITLNAAAGTIEVYNTTTEKVSTVVNPSGEANYTGIVTATGGLHVGTAATIYANGNISCGILTATNFIGDGSGLTGVANTDNVVSTTLSVSGVVTAIGGLYVGTAASIYSNGNVTCGIVTATKYYGDGSSLSNVTSTTINNNANNRLITGSGTANTLEGESTLTYDGAALSVSTGATIFTNGNIACGIITATSFTVGGTSLAETIADTVGGMVSSNTESGITVAYQDADNTLDFTVGTLNQNTTGTAGGLSGTPNITVGDVVAASLDISGNTDIDGTLEADAITVDGTALNEYIADTVGAMVSSNTESGITVAYVDDDNTLDFTVGTLNQDTTGTADNITVTANNSTDETVYPIFVDGATGSQGAESDTGLTYNPSDGNLTSTTFTGALTGNVTGNASGSSGSCTGNAAGLTGTPDITVDEITARNINLSGIATFAGNVNLGDTDYLNIGAGSDLKLYHTNDHSYIHQDGTGSLYMLTDTFRLNNEANSENIIAGNADGAVELYHNGSKKGETVSGGFTVTGTCSATTFSGSGASLTNIPGIASESDTSVSSTSATTVATLSASTYRAAIIDVLITQGSAYQAGQYGLIHDGTTATIVEQWAIATGDMLGTFTTTISGGNMLLQVNMGSSSSATVTVKSSTLTV